MITEHLLCESFPICEIEMKVLRKWVTYYLQMGLQEFLVRKDYTMLAKWNNTQPRKGVCVYEEANERWHIPLQTGLRWLHVMSLVQWVVGDMAGSMT